MMPVSATPTNQHVKIKTVLPRVGNASVPVQQAQRWFPGLAISNAEI